MVLLVGFSLGLLAIIFVIIARDFGHINVARVFLALLIAAAAFLLNEVVPLEWKWLTSSIMTMLPALFWLLCQLAFSRRPEVVSIWAVFALYSFIAPGVGRVLDASSDVSSVLYLLTRQFPVYAEYIVISQGIWVIIVNWSDDLISTRRRLRGALMGVVGVALLLVTGTLNFGYGSTHWLSALVAIAGLIVASLLLKGREGVLLGIVPPLTSAAGLNVKPSICHQDKMDAVEKSAKKLQEVMMKGFYRTEKLTLKMLADEIDLPEYKTRALINQTLGYRNFNDYINQLRIAEAGDHLIKNPNTPILNIALDVGYRTLSSFNRAFKEIHKQSPSEFRQSKVLMAAEDDQAVSV
ncbi:helix-turn-helix transcriptional regulator [Pleionea sediminis]|uniref:helix-turn-helix transcriptional regulator n=1 Tax=Pleionea sediminis TaxID=2569479 RepID=UPI0011853679|nr:helix-turn-helix transcriptional regulator [Pleionea sediminis]